MPEGRSNLESAQDSVLTVAQELDEIAESLARYKAHLEAVRAEVQFELKSSHQDDVAKEVLAALDAAIAALEKAIAHTEDAADKARRIEERT